MDARGKSGRNMRGSTTSSLLILTRLAQRVKVTLPADVRPVNLPVEFFWQIRRIYARAWITQVSSCAWKRG
jgi:hypothetical protein